MVAKLVSYVFHPLLITTYLVLLLSRFVPHFLFIPQQYYLPFIGLIFVMTFVLPVANIIMFKAFGTLTSFQMESRRERIIPFILITLTYGAVAVTFFYKRGIYFNFNRVMLIAELLAFGGTFATFFQKVSIHSLAMLGVVGILLPLNKAIGDGALRWPIVATLAFAGLVMSSRLYLNAHTPREVMVGAAIGFCLGFLGVVLLF